MPVMTTLSVEKLFASAITASASRSRLPRSACRLITERSLSFSSVCQSSLPPFPVGMPAARVIIRTISELGWIMKRLSSRPSYPAALILCKVSRARDSFPVTVPSMIC